MTKIGHHTLFSTHLDELHGLLPIINMQPSKPYTYTDLMFFGFILWNLCTSTQIWTPNTFKMQFYISSRTTNLKMMNMVEIMDCLLADSTKLLPQQMLPCIKHSNSSFICKLEWSFTLEVWVTWYDFLVKFKMMDGTTLDLCFYDTP